MEGRKITVFWPHGGWVEYMVDIDDQAPIPENSPPAWHTFRYQQANYLKVEFSKELCREVSMENGVCILYKIGSED